MTNLESVVILDGNSQRLSAGQEDLDNVMPADRIEVPPTAAGWVEHAPAQPQDQVKSALRPNVVMAQRQPVLQLGMHKGGGVLLHWARRRGGIIALGWAKSDWGPKGFQ